MKADLLKCAPYQAAKLWHPVNLRASLTSKEPVLFHGGINFPLLKKNKADAQQAVDAFRAI
eukprot:11935375-Karenia_brevis.AAC.1